LIRRQSCFCFPFFFSERMSSPVRLSSVCL